MTITPYWTDPDLDAIIIATPARTHYTFALKALQHGKHLFIEKPLTLEVQQAVELVELSEDTDRILMVGHLMEYHPAIEKAQGPHPVGGTWANPLSLCTTGQLRENTLMMKMRCGALPLTISLSPCTYLMPNRKTYPLAGQPTYKKESTMWSSSTFNFPMG